MNEKLVKRTKKVYKTIYSTILTIALVIAGVFGAYKLMPIVGQKLMVELEKQGVHLNFGETESKGSSSFTFMGVGDNLIHGAIYYWQEQEGRPFDFNEIYSMTLPYSQGADISYINGETILAGADFGYSSYPYFNGPTEIIDAVANAGFNWMSICSNHSYDAGELGLWAEIEYIEQHYPNFTFTGASRNQEEDDTPRVINVNGIRVGVQSYTYGLNSFHVPDDEEWLLNFIDKGKIEEDIELLNEVSDVQIVTMHWGTEYSTDVNEEQMDLAQFMNELGVDVIIGSHPHVIEKAEIIHGDLNDTLVYYSLGNFLSCQDSADRMVGGMASFTINYDFDTKKVTWDNVKFIPTITYFDAMYRTIRTTTIHEYTNEMAATHCYPATTLEFVREYVAEVMGNPEGIEVELQ